MGPGVGLGVGSLVTISLGTGVGVWVGVDVATALVTAGVMVGGSVLGFGGAEGAVVAADTGVGVAVDGVPCTEDLVACVGWASTGESVAAGTRVGCDFAGAESVGADAGLGGASVVGVARVA
jgi:hypothetical protein